jgi:hypothetical protein
MNKTEKRFWGIAGGNWCVPSLRHPAAHSWHAIIESLITVPPVIKAQGIADTPTRAMELALKDYEG